MKDIVTRIREGWEFNSTIGDGGDFCVIPNKAKWLMINTETEVVAAVTENDVDGFGEDFGDDALAKALKGLKVGETYDADGGITIYIRIKK